MIDLIAIQEKKKCPYCGRGGKPRSLKENSYLWGIVYSEIASETGHSSEDIHTAMKDMFLPKVFVTIGDNEYEVRKSTTDLTTSEMEDYLMRIRAFAAQELNLGIPLPNEHNSYNS